MRSLKPVALKGNKKQEREHRVLMGLIKLFIEDGKPVGSNTLRESLFPDLSSATIRNYFARLEEAGYLTQQHSSGGRLPTEKAFRVYANECVEARQVDPAMVADLQQLRQNDRQEVTQYLQEAAEILAKATQTTVFLSAPRFDHDFVTDIKLVKIDIRRCLCVVVTHFGLIQTEVLSTDEKLSTFALHRIEAYFHWRLTGYGKPENMKPAEEKLAQRFYNELMVRYVVGYANSSHEHVFATGFSNLLQYPEFQDAQALASGLSLFENPTTQRLLLREASVKSQTRVWIGSDLLPFIGENANCAVLAMPYRINQKHVGAIGVLGPMRLPYPDLIAALRFVTDLVSESLTKSIYKFNIGYRKAETSPLNLEAQDQVLLQAPPILLEDKRASPIKETP